MTAGMPASGRRLLARWSAAGLPPAAGEALLAKYAEGHRRYHTTAHLEALFSILDADPHAGAAAERLAADDRAVLELALFYHDREYDPRRNDNELRSAAQFLADAPGLPLADALRARVVDLVLLSRHHRPAPGDGLAELFCDLDLAVLGAAPDEYDRYARGVREEHAHVEEPLYRLGRRRVLGALARRHRLFHVLSSREAAARANLARERADLAPALPPLAAILRPLAALALLVAALWGAVVAPAVALLLGFLAAAMVASQARTRLLERRLRSGVPPFPDEARRRHLWSALSELYLDTEVDPGALARAVAATGYGREEVDRCLRREVGPLLAGNLGWGVYPVIGAWAGFEEDWLRTEIVLRACRPRSRLEEALAGRLSTWFVAQDVREVMKRAFPVG